MVRTSSRKPRSTNQNQWETQVKGSCNRSRGRGSSTRSKPASKKAMASRQGGRVSKKAAGGRGRGQRGEKPLIKEVNAAAPKTPMKLIWA
jgi:hypothetical protein